MASVAAFEAEVFSATEMSRGGFSLSNARRRDPAIIEHGSEIGWRTYLTGLGVDAAIMLCELRGAEGGRHLYLVGLAQAKDNADLAEAVTGYAETMWQNHPHESFHAYRIGDTLSTDRAGFGQASTVGNLAFKALIAGFEYGAVMHATSGADGMSALLLRKKDSGAFGEPTQKRLLDIFPLVHEAATAQMRSARNEQRAGLLAAMFDQVSLATLLISATGRPIFANEAAREMLKSRRFILSSADGTLACAEPAQTKLLRAAVQSVTTGAGNDEEISIRIGQLEMDWRLAVVVPASTTVGDKQIRCAMMLIHKPQHGHAPSHMLKALGLLPSEQRFLESFLKTSSLSEAATHSGLSEETARTYLKRVRGKLGVHRQLELARLIYGLVPPIRSVKSLVEA